MGRPANVIPAFSKASVQPGGLLQGGRGVGRHEPVVLVDRRLQGSAVGARAAQVARPSKTTRPPTIVSTGQPSSSQPENGGIASLAREVPGLHSGAAPRIEHRHVGRRAGGESPTRKPQDAGRRR